MGRTLKRELFRFFWEHVPGFPRSYRAYRRYRKRRMTKWRRFANVWTRPDGEEVARWEWRRGEVPGGFHWRYQFVREHLIETHYGDGEVRFRVRLDPDEIARMLEPRT